MTEHLLELTKPHTAMLHITWMPPRVFFGFPTRIDSRFVTFEWFMVISPPFVRP